MKSSIFLLFVGLLFVVQVQNAQGFFFNPIESTKSTIDSIDKLLRDRVNNILNRAKVAAETIDKKIDAAKNNVVNKYTTMTLKLDEVVLEAAAKNCKSQKYDELSKKILFNKQQLETCVKKYREQNKDIIDTPTLEAQKVIDFLDTNTARAKQCVDEVASNFFAGPRAAACLVSAKAEADAKVLSLEPLFNGKLRTLESFAKQFKTRQLDSCDIEKTYDNDFNDSLSLTQLQPRCQMLEM
uniref:Uncharacterized protein n=1 Tax=Trichogramma kaykai TaxID=54128 RepID=A0ABD2XFG2_9HYME